MTYYVDRHLTPSPNFQQPYVTGPFPSFEVAEGFVIRWLADGAKYEIHHRPFGWITKSEPIHPFHAAQIEAQKPLDKDGKGGPKHVKPEAFNIWMLNECELNTPTESIPLA